VNKKEQICLVNQFPIYPPRNGGQLRVYHMAKNLAEYFDVKVLTLSHPLKRFHEDILFDGLTIKNVPQLSVVPGAFLSRMFKLPLGESTTPSSSNLAFKFKKILRDTILSSEIVVSEHPYLFPLIAPYADKKILVYSAHNVDFLLKKDIFAKRPIFKKLLIPRIEEVERLACSKSRIILTTCEDDKRELSHLYNISMEKIYVAPNGVDSSEITPCSRDEKDDAKNTLGLEDKKIVSFIGSGHPANIEATEYIISNIAPKLINCEFLIVGDVGKGIKKINSKNVRLMGFVDEEMKKTILMATDIALNPMFHGSGTNLKMLEYLAAGLPTISSPVGARGIEIKDYKNVIIGWDFAEKIEELFAHDELRKNLARNGRKLVEERYNWKKIAKGINEIYKGLIDEVEGQGMLLEI
jgi:glycosyltransferase involved in cell wall biosynthesis